LLRFLSVFLFLLSLTACDISAKFDEAERKTAEAVQLIKTELNVEPSLSWNMTSDFDGDFLRVTIEFPAEEVRGIDIKKLELISRKAIIKAFKSTPDEMIVKLISSNKPNKKINKD